MIYFLYYYYLSNIFILTLNILKKIDTTIIYNITNNFLILIKLFIFLIYFIINKILK